MTPTTGAERYTMTLTPNNTLGHVKPPPCACWRCDTSRALSTLLSAHQAALEETQDIEVELRYLRDEVAAAIAGPLSQVKGRLRAALEGAFVAANGRATR